MAARPRRADFRRSDGNCDGDQHHRRSGRGRLHRRLHLLEPELADCYKPVPRPPSHRRLLSVVAAIVFVTDHCGDNSVVVAAAPRSSIRVPTRRTMRSTTTTPSASAAATSFLSACCGRRASSTTTTVSVGRRRSRPTSTTVTTSSSAFPTFASSGASRALSSSFLSASTLPGGSDVTSAADRRRRHQWRSQYSLSSPRFSSSFRTSGFGNGASFPSAATTTTTTSLAASVSSDAAAAAAARTEEVEEHDPVGLDGAISFAPTNGSGSSVEVLANADAAKRRLGGEQDAVPSKVPASTAIGIEGDGDETEEGKDMDRLLSGLESRPVPGGNWNVRDPLGWTLPFGSRSVETAKRLEPLVKLRPGDDGYHDVSDVTVPNVSIVRTVDDARIVLEKLMTADPTIVHACDTEVMDIDLKNVGPVGNGYVTCASVYSGPDFDYGLGDGPGTALWIDNLDDAHGVLQVFKPWFENDTFLKVWHNVGFDRHVMWNEGIDCRGFGGDTMHMARLQDTSRSRVNGNGGGGGYSLEALTAEVLGRRKRPMKEIFGVPRLRKDGTEGSLIDVPPVEVLQRDPKHRAKWIMYSAYDAEGTWLLREKLQEKLEKMPWVKQRNLYDYYEMHMREFGMVLTDMERRGILVDKAYLADVEVQARADRAHHMSKFRAWAASQIGPDGLALNPASSVQLQTFLFGGAENVKTRALTEEVRVFKVPREEIPDEAIEAYKERDQQRVEDGQAPVEPETDDFDQMNVAQLKLLCKERGLKVSGRKAELQERLRGHFLAGGEDTVSTSEDDFDSMSDDDLRDACIVRELSDAGNRKALLDRLRDDSAYALECLAASAPKDRDGYKIVSDALRAAANQDGGEGLKEILAELKAKSEVEPKHMDVTIRSIHMKPEKYTAGGAPSVTADVLRKLAGDPFGDEPKYGTAYNFFGGGKAGHEACVALYSLTAIGSIDTMIANFLTSLQSLADDRNRVHCSLNLNTETGRLSSRRPNLQNQPALEKDKYKIRKAFQSSQGNNLIVADYGQLELRLLASMTNCKSMIEAFEAGGDFHSRTALGMFDYIKKKVDDGECLLEWDYADGDPPKPMLKDQFASERRKAKTLNFSIAYGKTAHGLSQDWGVSQKEAEEMLQAWYNSRPEVLKWQQKTKADARKYGITRTLMGRYRQLPGAQGRDRKVLGHAERASINTPIQGGAADVAMMAMIKINNSKVLKRLGWILLMQIHDEVILEGPEETAKEAFAEVLKCMEEPWVFGLDKTSVPLSVDGSYVHKNWYDAK